VVYAVGMVVLSYFDEKILPGLQRKGVIPYNTKEDQAKAEEDQRQAAAKTVRTLTPITAQHRPLVDKLDEKGYYIGSVDGVRQYLCVRKADGLDEDDALAEECFYSEEFSAMYKQPLVICKRLPKIDRSDMAP